MTIIHRSKRDGITNGQGHQIFMRKSSYCFQHVLAIAILSVRPSVCPSVCQSHGWISQKRCKLKSPNFHHRCVDDSSFRNRNALP